MVGRVTLSMTRSSKSSLGGWGGQRGDVLVLLGKKRWTPSIKHLHPQNGFLCEGVPFLQPMSWCGALWESHEEVQAVLNGCCCRFVPSFLTNTLWLGSL